MNYRCVQNPQVGDWCKSGPSTSLRQHTPKSGGEDGGQTREEIVVEVCKDLFSKTHKIFDQKEFEGHLKEEGETNPINSCLNQEVDVLDRILIKVIKTLKDFQLVIDDTIVMSDDLTASRDDPVSASSSF